MSITKKVSAKSTTAKKVKKADIKAKKVIAKPTKASTAKKTKPKEVKKEDLKVKNVVVKKTSTKTVKDSSKKEIEEKTIKSPKEGNAVQTQHKNVPPNENNPDEQLARSVIELDLIESEQRVLKELTKNPETMEEFLDLTGYTMQGLKKRQEVAATITNINKRTVFFDIGAKTEGILIEKEMEYVKDYIKFLAVGDTVHCVVVSPENDKGQILLSLRRAATKWKWDLFEKYMAQDLPVEVRGLDINRGGMISRILNVHGFIPVSQFSRQWTNKIDQLYNKVFSVKIIEVDREKNRLIFSERAVSEADVMQKQQLALQNVKNKDKYKGEVSGVMPFGIFVRVFVQGEESKEVFLDGLVHISEISWEKVSDVARIYNVGDIVDIQVIDVDTKGGKLNLSIKRLKDNPWKKFADKYAVDSKLDGKITRIVPYGVFVELEDGLEGLIHVSKIPSDMEFESGQTVGVYIESIDTEHHRISLGVSLSAKPVGYK